MLVDHRPVSASCIGPATRAAQHRQRLPVAPRAQGGMVAHARHSVAL